ncbi:MAG: OmpA family protein [Nitrospirota bacterium]|nr:OmpA family protein [Nitrospirota bacterium]MDH5574080.1 OmpA family protein [Nitrospirota bacterium]
MDHGPSSSPTTAGVIDLMTSLAMIFILLFAAFITQTSSEAQSQLRENKEDVQAALRDHLGRLGLSLNPDPRDPLTLLIVVPENRLTFEFGRSTLSPEAIRFLEEAIPFYAAALCGPLRDKIDSLAIQGHTDDRGDDVYNLKLSQERSLAVMVKGLEVIEAQEPSAYQCFQEMTSASGRGRQDLVYDADNRVSPEKSRRVIFKIRLSSTEQRHMAERLPQIPSSLSSPINLPM